jgi:hypothetical protein
MRPIALFSTLFAALSIATAVQAAEPITPEAAPVVVYRAGAGFDDTRTNLELAITGRGLNISNTLRISDMLERASADLGLAERIYQRAESVEFCSIAASYQMSLAHPANLSICPLVISVYSPAQEPEAVYVAFRRPQLLGDGEAAARQVLELLDGIAQEAAE